MRPLLTNATYSNVIRHAIRTRAREGQCEAPRPLPADRAWRRVDVWGRCMPGPGPYPGPVRGGGDFWTQAFVLS